MECWLNLEIQVFAKSIDNCVVENEFKGTGYVSKAEKENHFILNLPR